MWHTEATLMRAETSGRHGWKPGSRYKSRRLWKHLDQNRSLTRMTKDWKSKIFPKSIIQIPTRHKKRKYSCGFEIKYQRKFRYTPTTATIWNLKLIWFFETMILILKSRNLLITILIRNFLKIKNIWIRTAIHGTRELSRNSKLKKSKLKIYDWNLK